MGPGALSFQILNYYPPREWKQETLHGEKISATVGRHRGGRFGTLLVISQILRTSRSV
jgi:hypothetical protein